MSTATRFGISPLAHAITAPLEAGGTWPPDRAYENCERLARSHYENFPVGSTLIPKRLRKHFYSIYAFARIADDFADEGHGEGYSERERLDLLDEWRRMLTESLAGRAGHPVFVALAQTIAEFNLPPTLFEDLLSAFAQDVTLRRYESFDELLDYCRRSANPIGRLILLLIGYRDEQRHRWSDDICTALQLANHWQDVAIDLDKDRIYLPHEDLSRFELTVEDLMRRQASEGFRRMMKFEVERAREIFARGKPLCTSVSGRLGLELRVVWLGGMRILQRTEENDYDVFAHRPVITVKDKLKILLVAANKGTFRRY
jgi:squalene synthase HpnC